MIGNGKSSTRFLTIAATFLMLALVACNIPGCGATTPPATPGRTVAIPPTSNPAQLPPTNPQIVAQQPSPGEELPLDGSIDLYFDQPMNQTTVENAVSFSPAVNVNLVWVDDSTLRVTPAAGALQRATHYKIEVADSAQSAHGLMLNAAYEADVQTVGFLAVGDVVPAPDAAAVETDSVITVFFNRPVVPLGIAEDTPNLPQPLSISPEVAGQGGWLNTSIYQWKPAEGLAGGQTYTVSVSGDLTDQTGGVMEAPYSWSFTTLPPEVIEVSPSDVIADVGLDEPIQVTFNQPMDRASTQAAFSLLNKETGQVATGTFSWSEGDRVMSFKPDGGLALDGSYAARVETSARSASGFVPLSGEGNWVFWSVHTPGIISTEPAANAENVPVYTGLHFTFSSPMKESTLTENRVQVEPALPDNATTYYSDYDHSFHINSGLEPSTTYSVTFLPGASDPYGNVISEPYSFSFTTAPLDPLVQLNVQGAFGLYDANQPTELFLLYRNISQLNFSLSPLSLEEFGRFSGPNGYEALSNYRPSADELVRNWTIDAPGLLNEANYVKVPLGDEQGRSLQPGIYLMIADAPEIQGDIRHFVLVVNGNLTLKSSFDESLVWLTDLDSGQPINGATVTVYSQNFQQVAKGKTDRQGVLEVDTNHLQGLWDTRYAIAQQGDTFAVAISDWGDGINAWDFNLPSQFDFQNFSLYLYTDRPLYRPGQEVFFKGILRSKNDVTYTLPSKQTIPIKVYNDQGDVVSEQTLTVSEAGTFNGSITLDAEAGLGYYSIQVDDGSIQGGIGFQVAEYRKPEFQVTAEAAEPEVVEGDTIRVTVDAQFFFGGPVSDADVEWNVLAGDYYFNYSGPGNYSFYDYNPDQGFGPDFIPGFGEVIASGSGTTDGSGKLVVTLPASLDDAPASRLLTFEATVTDINQQSVSGRTQITVHKGQYYVGVSPDAYVTTAGDSASASLIVVDWNSQPVANQDVTVEVLEQRWNSVQEEDEFGRTQWTWSVEQIPVGDTTTVRTDGKGKASVTFTPPKGGEYKIRATVADAARRTQTASAYLWVSGQEYVSWRQNNNDRIDLVTDKQQYEPGETAEVLIASPFQGSDVKALVTLERGSILTHEVITLTSNSFVYRVPITGDLAPNTFISVVIVKGIDSTNPVPAYKMGLVEIQVDPVEQTIQLEVTPDKETVGPQDEVTYTIRTTDSNGKAVNAEVSLALVDLATLSLAAPNSGPIVAHFYGVQGLGVRTAVPLGYLVNRRNQELFDLGKGGGGGGGEGFFDVRGDFRDTAFWSAVVNTGNNGRTTVKVTLPDNLTTWRMDARAVTADTLVGQAQVDIVATKPLLIRPATPRFFVVGDEATVSAVINNNTDSAIDATVKLDASGVSMVGDREIKVSIPARGRTDVGWAVVVDANAEWVNMVFSVDGGRLSDASKPPLGNPDHDQMIPVYKYEVPETVGTAGQLTGAASRIEGVVLPPTYEVTQGEVRVEIDPSLAASTVDGLTWLEHYPYECTEQTVSRFLPNALTLTAFRQLGLNDPGLEANLDAQVAIGLQRLYSQQHVDGGWGWFVTGTSNPTVSAYVIQGMVAAKEAGVQVEARVLNDGLSYLTNQLRPVDALNDHVTIDRQAYLLYVLARAGQPDVSRSVQLFENREGLQSWARALLAQTLWMIDPNDPRLSNLQSDLVNSAIVSATGAHWEEETNDYWNWNTDTRSTAIILDTFALIWPTNDLAPNITRWLMIARKGGHWETTQETAWALIGLTHWMVATGELQPDYTWEFQFNGAKLADGTASADTVNDPTVLYIDVKDLVTDEVNRLLFERTDGAGRMYYTAHLTAYLPVEQVEPLSRGVIVSRRYLDANGKPVTEGHVGDTLMVELTIVAPNDLYYAVVEDPYPAGAEAVDVNLLTESILGQRPTLQPTDPLAQGWGWWWFSQTDFRDEKAVLFADTLPKGTYQYTYQIRLGLPGTYRVIPPTAREFYLPEVYGRGSGMLFTILPLQ